MEPSSSSSTSDFRRGFLLIAVSLSIAGGFLGASFGAKFSDMTLAKSNDVVPEPVEQQKDTKTVYVEESGIIDAVDKVSPAVVSIVVSKDLPLIRQQNNFNDFFLNDPFGNPFFTNPDFNSAPAPNSDNQPETQRRKIGGGSGFIVTQDGLILTNKHVVSNANADYTVVLSDGTEYPATVVSRDILNDIAFVKATDADGNDLSDLPVVTVGDSSALKVGQRVLAIGNALSEYNNTVTTGIISGKGRDIAAGTINSTENLINLLQTDAAINPGNSGGPLVNLNGEVIGVNTAIASGAEGIGFAIAIDDVKPMVDSIKKNGRLIRPFLGVRYMMLDKNKADELKIDVSAGALLVGDEANGQFAVVPASPAEKAGLQIKDVILEINGEPVTAEKPLQAIIAKFKPEDWISLKIWRSGKELTLKATLEEAK